MTQKAIYLDMDGTIANLYSVPNWLPKLRAFDPTPYREASPLVRMNRLARLLNHLKNEHGYVIGIVSWLSKEPDIYYDKAVSNAKREWLAEHLPSVQFDEIHIVAYGTPKSSVVECPFGILFDDEQQNREEWKGMACDPFDILNILKALD